MNTRPSEYYVSIGDHSEPKASYYEAINGTVSWNVNVGTISKGKGYVNFSTENTISTWYQLTIIKLDNGHN